jgi:hypothetical protein
MPNRFGLQADSERCALSPDEVSRKLLILS